MLPRRAGSFVIGVFIPHSGAEHELEPISCDSEFDLGQPGAVAQRPPLAGTFVNGFFQPHLDAEDELGSIGGDLESDFGEPTVDADLPFIADQFEAQNSGSDAASNSDLSSDFSGDTLVASPIEVGAFNTRAFFWPNIDPEIEPEETGGGSDSDFVDISNAESIPDIDSYVSGESFISVHSHPHSNDDDEEEEEEAHLVQNPAAEGETIERELGDVLDD